MAKEMTRTAKAKGASATAKGAGDADESAQLGDIVQRARTAFEERNLRFTQLREQVFSEIASTRGSIGAYEILERLSDKGTRLAPISVYRSIDALIEAGVIHRLESKNSYFACRRHEHGRKGRPIFMSCEQCGSVVEVPAQAIFDQVAELARSVDFTPKVKFMEVSGICSECRDKAKSD